MKQKLKESRTPWKVVFQKARPVANTPPSGGFQFFGQIDIEEHSKVLSVALKDLNGTKVFGKRLEPRLLKHGHDDRWD